MSFEEKIKNWVLADNEIKTFNENLKELKKTRQILTNDLQEYIETHELKNAVIQISDGKLKSQQVKAVQPLTLKYVKECLSHCVSNTETVDQLMEYIKQHREIKFSDEIKRYYNK
uniref:Uncharacterized protein n=1 Tax=viral metagenome TaxID=1070528 RepID=A0A6C0KDV2_9ZZZZ